MKRILVLIFTMVIAMVITPLAFADHFNLGLAEYGSPYYTLRGPALSMYHVDEFGNSIQYPHVNQNTKIMKDIVNYGDHPQPYSFIVQIKDDNDKVIHLSWINGTLSEGHGVTASVSWIPTTKGEFTITSFVWVSIDMPIVLSVPHIMKTDVYSEFSHNAYGDLAPYTIEEVLSYEELVLVSITITDSSLELPDKPFWEILIDILVSDFYLIERFSFKVDNVLHGNAVFPVKEDISARQHYGNVFKVGQQYLASYGYFSEKWDVQHVYEIEPNLFYYDKQSGIIKPYL